MEKDYSAFIGQYLGKTRVMEPVPTSVMPVYHQNGLIRAVVLDVYGTMLISESGDIEESVISTMNIKKALEASKITITAPDREQSLLSGMLESFKEEIYSVHLKEKTEQNPYPEVDILEIWERILNERNAKNELLINDELCVKCFTFVFEVLSNNIYPMPGMKDVIRTLKAKNIPLGIISNAQFYTPLILNYFLGNPINESVVPPFDPDITVFSYQFKKSKPDHFLFHCVADKCLEKFSVQPAEILYVGNDMFRDIYPAANVSFKTALFAGDKRSLRLRSDLPGISELNPDYTITDLRQILNIIGS